VVSPAAAARKPVASNNIDTRTSRAHIMAKRDTTSKEPKVSRRDEVEEREGAMHGRGALDFGM